jgi:hypothetical protein
MTMASVGGVSAAGGGFAEAGPAGVATSWSETKCREEILSHTRVFATRDPVCWQTTQASAPLGNTPVTG